MIPSVSAAGVKNEISVKNIKVPVEIAATEAERTRGLMYRNQLDADSGMLFIMEHHEVMCMWMQNTYIPLSVAFIDKNGEIINIEQMKPLSRDLHCSNEKAQYALEMNLGWFKKHQIRPGDKISGLPKLP